MPNDVTIHQLAFRAYGVGVLLAASDARLMARVGALVPPGATPCRAASVPNAAKFSLVEDKAMGYRVFAGGKPGAGSADLEVALGLLDSVMRLYLGAHSTEWLFMHAGCVSHRGRGILIPGGTLVGKTTLVAELVRAGAVYFSDECAILDREGFVHPYAKPLSIRDEDLGPIERRVDSFGGVSGTSRAPVGMVVITCYRPGAAWRPRELSVGEGVLALMPYATPLSDRPEQTLRTITSAVAGARILQSERDEAGPVAEALLGLAAGL